MSAIMHVSAAAAGLGLSALTVQAGTGLFDREPVPKRHWLDAGTGLGLFAGGGITATMASESLDLVRPGPMATLALVAGVALMLGGAGMFTVGTARGIGDAF